MKRRLATLAAIMLTALPLAAQDNPIVLRMIAFTEAYNAGDAAAVAGFYTADGVLLPPNAPTLQGHEAIAAHYAAAFAAGVGGLEVNILEIRGHGPDAAVMIAETQVSAGAQTVQARFVHVWRLVEGNWLLSRDIYNVIAVQ